jgi:hypothetical protein
VSPVDADESPEAPFWQPDKTPIPSNINQQVPMMRFIRALRVNPVNQLPPIGASQYGTARFEGREFGKRPCHGQARTGIPPALANL